MDSLEFCNFINFLCSQERALTISIINSVNVALKLLEVKDFIQKYLMAVKHDRIFLLDLSYFVCVGCQCVAAGYSGLGGARKRCRSGIPS